MAANEGFKESEEFVYRISTAEEWEELQRSAATFGGDLDQSTGCFHLSKLNQVQSTLQNFFLNVKEDLYLLQIDAKKLGDGLIYESADDSNIFPHFYSPSRSFSPLPLDAVVKAEKLTLSDAVARLINHEKTDFQQNTEQFESTCSQCSRKPVIFNLGDSNSDTGGLAAAMDAAPSFMGQQQQADSANHRFSVPYLEAVQADFSNGGRVYTIDIGQNYLTAANAIVASAILSTQYSFHSTSSATFINCSSYSFY